jgi:DnaJ-class molecular chaperone
MTHYQLLGIAKDATAEEIRKAYRKMAAAMHPDRFANADRSEDARQDRQRQFQEVADAYRTLSDDRARYAYDRAIRVPQGLGDLLATHEGQRAMARLLPRAQKQAHDGEDKLAVVRVPPAVLATGGTVQATGLPEGFDPLFLPPSATASPWGRLPGRGEPGENEGKPGDLYVLVLPSSR